MEKYIRTSGIIIEKLKTPNEILEKIKNNLTRTSVDYLGYNTIEMKFFIDGNNYLKIPRFFPIQKYIKDCVEEDKLSNGEDISIEHKIVLRDDLQIDMANYLLNNDCGLIQAQPASGKTIVSIYMICNRKKKTFILVHRDTLADQWKDKFLETTNIKIEDIVRMKSSTYKEDLKKSVIITTDQTFISLLKRDRASFLKELNESKIGIFIADEVHTSVGAPTFAECSIHIPAKYVYGLSATPNRYDGNTDIIKYHLGEIYIPKGKATTMAAKVTIILFSFGLVSSKTRGYIYWGGRFNKSRYLNQLKKSESLISISKTLLDRFIKEKREIIFVSERIKFIDKLFEELLYENKSKFIRSAKNELLEYQVTFATPGKVRDGVDIPKKDCLILTSPIGNIDQMGGRICRVLEGKPKPIIIDMVDIDEPEIYRTIFNRIKFYKNKTDLKQEEWELQFIYVDKNGKSTKIDEDYLRKLLKNKELV